MELNHLRYFQEVARTENISKAAKTLFVTQPALSVTIKKLETELGYPLFKREGNRIKLTEAGSCFLSYVNSMFSILEEGAEKARQVAEQADHVMRIASGFGIIRDLTSEYQAEHPEIRFETRCIPTDEIVRRLTSGRADLGLVMGDVNDSRLESRTIMTGRFFVCVNHEHPLAQYEGGSVRMADLEGQLLFCSNIAKTYETASGIFKKAGVSCNLLTLDEKDVLFSAADKGLGGVFCMPMKEISPETRGGELVWLPIADCDTLGRVVLLKRKEVYYTEEQGRFISFLERRFARNEAYIRSLLTQRGVEVPEEMR